MKKILLLVFALMTTVAFSQNQNYLSPNSGLKISKNKNMGANETIFNTKSGINLPPSILDVTANPLERIVGNTTYDLQTNTSIDNRIINTADGKVSIAWTFSTATSTSTLDRGTGYAFFDGTTWQENPTTRIESKRTGWPCLANLGNGSEYIISHNTDDGQLQLTYRPTLGDGQWTEDITKLPSPIPDGNWWPRMTSGGVDGNSLHVISLTYPTANGGTIYQGLDGALTYSRSTDGGQNWDKVHEILTGMTSGEYLSFSADDYAFANSRGNTIAFAVGGVFQDLFLMKSTDNGDTWTKTLIHQFPVPFFDDAHTLVDSTFSNDGAVAVVLDANNVAHVFFGGVSVVNDDTTDAGQYTYFPYTSALYYWNENFGSNPPDSIASVLDKDANGIGDILTDITPGYATSVVSQPSAGIDADGNLYVAYSAIVEDFNDGTYQFRHVYLMKSIDGGQSWTYPVDLNYTLEEEFNECVFASLANNVDDNLHIVYQRDFETGMWIRPDPGTHEVATNEIVYVTVPKSLNVSIKEEHSLFDEFSVYPNPAGTSTKVSFTVNKAENVVVNVLNVTGQIIASFSNHAMAGRNSLDINVENFSSGIYFINAQIGDEMKTQKLIVK